MKGIPAPTTADDPRAGPARAGAEPSWRTPLGWSSPAVYLGIGGLLIALGLFVWTISATVRSMSAANAEAVRTETLLRGIADVRARVAQLDASYRRYAVTGSISDQSDWRAARVAIMGALVAVRRNGVRAGTAARLPVADSLIGQWTARQEAAGVLLPPGPEGRARVAESIQSASRSMEQTMLRQEIERHLRAIESAESLHLQTDRRFAQNMEQRVLLLALLASGFVATATFMLLFALIQRSNRLSQLNRLLEREGTERGFAEAALERLGRRHRLILESAADGILELNAAGTVTFLNPAAIRLLGVTGSHAAGVSFRQMLAGADEAATGTQAKHVARTMDAIDAALRDGAVHEDTNGLFLPKNRSPLPVEVLIAPIRDRGEIAGAVLTFRDATQRREIARMKDEFVGMVSHELRTPLTSVRGSLGLLLSGKLGTLTDAGHRMLAIAVQNTDRLIRLINDILDVERMESGLVLLRREPIAAGHLVDDAIAAVEATAERARVTITLEGRTDLRVSADRDRIVQALTNLLDNAVKFSPTGGSVRVAIDATGHEVRFTVSDTGRGIPTDALESVFDRFRQLDSTATRDKGGSGLGLTITRAIIEQHGGRIWAESANGTGATFHFTLPGHLAEATPADRPLVLVCDEDVASASAIHAMLERNGYAAAVCSTEDEFVEVAASRPPAAVLLGRLAQASDDWALLESLRDATDASCAPIVVLRVIGPDASCAGDVDGCVVDPVDEATLVEALEAALSRRTPRRVLVVEDDLDLARVLVTTLRTHGIEAEHAATGRDAIRLCEQREPDMVILDLVLPDGDGFDVVDWLRRHDRLRAAPLVIYSAKEVDGRDRYRLQLGPTEFVTKGRVAPDELERRILALLRQAVDTGVEAA